LNLQVVTSK